MSNDKDARIYVGNLPSDIRQKEIESIFDKYGKINKVELKNGPGRGAPFAFIEFDDYRDAEDAIRAKHGSNFDGRTLRVEAPHGGRGGGGGGDYRGSSRGRGPPRYDDRSYRGGGGYDRGYDRGGYDRGGYDRDRGGNRGGADRGGDRGYGGGGRDRGDRGPPAGGRRSKYRVIITGLPASGSWQDLKDHMREAGDICYADVRNGQGIVEYQNEDDMKYALKKLNDTEFKSHEGERAFIRVKEDKGSVSRSRSRSPEREKRKRSASPRRRSRSPSS